MGKQDSQIISRRSFLRGSAVAGACILSAGVLGATGCDYLNRADQSINVLSARIPGPDGGRPGRSTLSELSLEGVRTRLSIMSDSHLCTYDDTAGDKLTIALETLGRIAPGIDSFFMLGDITLNGYDDELESFASLAANVISDNFPSKPIMHLLMGNHDFWGGNESQFERVFARHVFASYFAAQQNTVALVNGATIIKLNGPGSYDVDQMDFSLAYDFLVAALEEASIHRPNDAILVMAHEPPQHMNLPEPYEHGNFGQGTSTDMIEQIARYPQARMFTGHVHNPLDIKETVNTDLAFTSVHTSTVGSCFFIRGELVDVNETGSQGLVLDIMDDGSLVLHFLDFYEQEYIGEPVTI